MKHNTLSLSKGLRELVELSAPYWGAEAEIIRAYWGSPVRTEKTDKKWLTHQVYKEYCNGVAPYLEMLNKQFLNISNRESRSRLLELAEVVYEEVEHYSMFADLFSLIDGTDFNLTGDELNNAGAWPENDELMNLRKEHIEASPYLGERAMRFTEGGYVALFSEGMKLAGRGVFEDAISKVCKKIHDDEFSHMLLGIIETDSDSMSEEEWSTLQQFSVEQLKKRLMMRNAQFSFPVSENRMQELIAGNAKPVTFDYPYAEQLLNKKAA